MVTFAVLALTAAVAFAQEPPPILGDDGDNQLLGTPLGDSIYGRGGNDILAGLDGEDELDGGPGHDIISGGPADDSVAYSGAPVRVTLDNVADDGAAGEGDNIGKDVEDVYGTEAGDTLIGSEFENTLDGNGGPDTIDGGPGQDGLYGGDGDDVIRSRDGSADRVECGPGIDSAQVDTKDSTTPDCEEVGFRRKTERFSIAKVEPGGGPRARVIVFLNVPSGARMTIACVSGCRPRSSKKRAIYRHRVTARKGKVRIRLKRSPQLVVGSTFEIGVKARGALPRCIRYRLAGPNRRSISKLQVLRRKRCTSVASKG